MIIYLHFDNILIFVTNIDVSNNTKLFISSQFEIKDLSEADVILGVKIRKTKNDFLAEQL